MDSTNLWESIEALDGSQLVELIEEGDTFAVPGRNMRLMVEVRLVHYEVRLVRFCATLLFVGDRALMI